MTLPDLTDTLGGTRPAAADSPELLAAGDYDPPIWLQGLTYPAQVDRQLVDGIWPNSGVLTAGALAVGPRAAGGNLSVDVAPGSVVIAGGDMAGQGKYLGHLKNVVNVPLTAAPAAGLVRIDLIHAHIYDATVVAGTRNEMTVEEAIAGTAVSANPTPPAVPHSSEPLAQVLVAAGTAAVTAAMITDRRRHAATPPYTLAGEEFPTTDVNGDWAKILPVGGKLISGVAVTMVPPGTGYVWARRFDGAGDTQCVWRLFYTVTGLPAGGVATSISYVIVWSY